MEVVEEVVVGAKMADVDVGVKAEVTWVGRCLSLRVAEVSGRGCISSLSDFVDEKRRVEYV